jgi:hypothetical protein
MNPGPLALKARIILQTIEPVMLMYHVGIKHFNDLCKERSVEYLKRTHFGSGSGIFGVVRVHHGVFVSKASQVRLTFLNDIKVRHKDIVNLDKQT